MSWYGKYRYQYDRELERKQYYRFYLDPLTPKEEEDLKLWRTIRKYEKIGKEKSGIIL